MHNSKLHVNMEKKHFKFIQLLNILPYLFKCLLVEISQFSIHISLLLRIKNPTVVKV